MGNNAYIMKLLGTISKYATTFHGGSPSRADGCHLVDIRRRKQFFWIDVQFHTITIYVVDLLLALILQLLTKSTS